MPIAQNEHNHKRSSCIFMRKYMQDMVMKKVETTFIAHM